MNQQRGALDIQGLHVDYAVGSRRLRALHCVTVSVPAGHRMAIVGESGSGKSTLGLAVMGLLPRNSASASESLAIDGGPIDLSSPRSLRKVRGSTIAMVFQDAKASLDPVRTIGSQIAEVLRVHEVVDRRSVRTEVERLLAAVEIKNPDLVARLYPHELSGGMRQRAMIASALAGRPSVLIADEPTSALDVTTQATVIDLLHRLGETGEMTTLLITHDLALVAGFADSVTVLYAGEVMEIGSVERLYSNPSHPYTRALLGSIPSIASSRSAVLGSIPGSLPDLTVPSDGCVFEPRCPIGQGREICRTRRPELIDHTSGSKVACHFADEVGATAATAGQNAHPTPVELTSRGELVRMSSIVKSFGRGGLLGGRNSKTIALAGVDLSINQGESVGVVGESGSGKTTLARTLIGLETADSGSIAIEMGGGMADVDRLPKDFAQFVFQDPGDSLNPLMSIAQIISEPLVLSDGGRASTYRTRVEELLDDVGLGASMADRRPFELSGGQRQRVAIARALSTRPKLIIADEAVASLDMSARGQILNLLADLQREHGFAYLHISHDLSMVRHVCDRVVVMYDGRVVESATVDSLFESPRHPYTQALISAVPIPDPAAERNRSRLLLQTEAQAGQAATGGCPFRFRCPLARDRCVAERPELVGEDDHTVACHFSDEAITLFGAGQQLDRAPS